ncbi:maleylpyruvate isomerase family mycothiol-dependent enzyme [Plantibacter flavus]|uniref:maleylpyruvate isomerase family mycothiol-dependent enzyme n=1 Tax=Plantibacter flavus TaxID=150123 RepID=UPI003F16C3EC
MQTTARTVWPIVRSERRALVADLEGLTEDQWASPSLCPGWSVHDVVAHLVDSAKTTRLSFAGRLLAARFDFDRDNERGIVRERRSRPADTLAALADAADLTRTPPGDLATRLVESFVHGEDIRRPLGIASAYPVDAVVAALDYQVRTSVRMGGGKERVRGLRLVVADAGIARGSGPEVRGDAIELLLAVSGRPAKATLPTS